MTAGADGGILARLHVTLATAILLIAICLVEAQAQPRSFTFAVQGETNLRTNFVADVVDASKDAGVIAAGVSRRDADYVIYIGQESSLGGAAAAVFAMDSGGVVATVIRSGRLSGRGAMNACAKELAKKLAILRR